MTTTPAEVEDLLRDLAPQVLAVVLHRNGDFYAAEDATQEALLSAAQRWPVHGIPTRALGWLVTTALHAHTDAARSTARRQLRETRYTAESLRTPTQAQHHDDSLALLFMCCHEVLTPSSAIALTLRAVGGLTTAEIAQAFLVPEATMAQRISRAKRLVADAGARFTRPTTVRQDPRTPMVLHVLYLMFNEGYVTSTGEELNRPSLTDEAIRLTRWVHELDANAADARGVLSLMLLTEARRPARTRSDGSLVPLAEQDRTRWNTSLMAEGLALLHATPVEAVVASPYLLQATIAATHDCAASVATTNWTQILTLYRALERLTPTPVVRLNQAVALAMVHGPLAGLARLDELNADLSGYHRLPAVRAHLLEMAGDVPGAVAAYACAADAAKSVAERNYLTSKAARLRTGRPPEPVIPPG